MSPANPPSTLSTSRRRIRTDSDTTTSSTLHAPKRRQYDPERDSERDHREPSPSNSHSSDSTASAASISQHYGAGDEGAASNLFAAWPNHFTSIPRPHAGAVLCAPRLP